jgi:hypothetical protein
MSEFHTEYYRKVLFADTIAAQYVVNDLLHGALRYNQPIITEEDRILHNVATDLLRSLGVVFSHEKFIEAIKEIEPPLIEKKVIDLANQPPYERQGEKR